jgi:uncharacterized protein YndB with AHSA1/START domain
MRRFSAYSVSARCDAPPGVVWTLLLSADSWPAWSTVDALDEARSQNLNPVGLDAVGAVRAFRTGWLTTAERIVALEPQRRIDYEDAWNVTLSHYQASIELTPLRGGGTDISWRGTYLPRFGWRTLLAFVLPRVMQKMASGLAEYADQSHQNNVDQPHPDSTM